MASNIGEVCSEGKVENLGEAIRKEKVENVGEKCPQKKFDSNARPRVNHKDNVKSEEKFFVLSQSQEASVDKNANFSNNIIEHKVKPDFAYIYVGQLPLNVNETYLRDRFKKYGNIRHVKLLKSKCKDEQHSYIRFQYRQNAERTIKAMHRSQMFDKTIIVRWADRIQDNQASPSDRAKSSYHPSKEQGSPSNMTKSSDHPSKQQGSSSYKEKCLDHPIIEQGALSDMAMSSDHPSKWQGSPSDMAKSSDHTSKQQVSPSDKAFNCLEHTNKEQGSPSDKAKCLDHTNKEQRSPSDKAKSLDHPIKQQGSLLKTDQCLDHPNNIQGSPSDTDKCLDYKHNQQGSPSDMDKSLDRPSNRQLSVTNMDKRFYRPFNRQGSPANMNQCSDHLCNQQYSPSNRNECLDPTCNQQISSSDLAQCPDRLSIQQGSPSDMDHSLVHTRSKVSDNDVIASKQFTSTPQHDQLKKFQLSKESSTNQSINKRLSSVLRGYSLVSVARAEQKEKISGMKYILEVSIKDEMESLSKALHRFETDKGEHNAKSNFEKKMLGHLKVLLDRALTAVDWSKLASLYNIITPYVSSSVQLKDPEVLARMRLDEGRSVNLERGVNALVKDLRNIISTFEGIEEGGNVHSVPDVEQSLRKIEARLNQSVLSLDEEMLNWAACRIDNFLDDIGLAWNLVQSDPDYKKALEQQETPLRLFRRIN